jgi:chemotaxis protein methyltransferase CheR
MNGKTELAGPDYETLCAILDREYGVDLRIMGRDVITSRLDEYCSAHGLTSMADCVRRIESDSERVKEIAGLVYSGHTHFNRDPDHFRLVVDTLQKERQAGRSPADPFVIWSLGCSTGQEAYTMVLYLLEYLNIPAGGAAPFRVEAADCSEFAVRHAQEGRYRLDDVQRLAPIPYQKYVRDDDEGYIRLLPSVKRHVSFRVFNLVSSPYPPPGSGDVVFLRNALDFHAQRSREAVLANVHATLRPGGRLILGGVSTLRNMRALEVAQFGYEQETPGCYCKVAR